VSVWKELDGKERKVTRAYAGVNDGNLARTVGPHVNKMKSCTVHWRGKGFKREDLGYVNCEYKLFSPLIYSFIKCSLSWHSFFSLFCCAG
jgi:hypothetical protein